MAFRVTITREAEAQFHVLSARDQRIIEAAVKERLRDQPDTQTKAIKALRANPFAQYELRIGDLRVLYNVEKQAAEVIILLIGKKVGNALMVGGEVFHDHEAYPSEPTGDGPQAHTP